MMIAKKTEAKLMNDSQDTQRVEEPAQGERTSSNTHSSLLWAQH